MRQGVVPNKTTEKTTSNPNEIRKEDDTCTCLIMFMFMFMWYTEAFTLERFKDSADANYENNHDTATRATHQTHQPAQDHTAEMF